MNNAYNNDAYPHAANDKHEALDWQNLPNSPCDMNYRLVRPVEGGQSAFIGLMVLAAFVSIVAYVLLTLTQPVWGAPGSSAPGAGTLLLIGCVTGLGYLASLITASHRGAESTNWTMVAIFVGTATLISCVGMFSPLARLVVWLIAAGVAMTHLADRIATSHLGWASAHPRVPRQVMTAYRLGWRRRWCSEQPSLPPADPETAAYRAIAGELLARYAAGPTWLVAALSLGLLAGTTTAKLIGAPLVALSVLIQTSLVLAVAAGVRLKTLPDGAASQVLDALGDYITSGAESRQPPWVYQDEDGPSSSRAWRISILAGVVGFFATATLLADPYPTEHVLPALLLTSGVTLLATPFWFFMGALLVAAPAVIAHHRALEVDGAFEHQEASDWDGYVRRLHESRNPLERRCLWSGCDLQSGHPILVDQSLYDEHAHVVGPTGSGKTAMTLMSDAIQIVRRPPSDPDAKAAVIIDCKGDRALFQTMRHEATAAGREFKWFTNLPDLDSYVFNPLASLASGSMSLAEVVGVIAQSLDLYHGEGYGRGFFGAGTRAFLEAAYKTSFTFDPIGGRRPPILSFQDLEDAIREECDDPQEMQAARHLLYVVAAMSQFPQMNVTGALPGDAEAVRQAIHMPTVIKERQVVYFYLAGAMDLSSVGHISRLALYCTMAAALEHRLQTGNPAGVHLIADEAQCLLSKNIQPILEQARSYGVACTLAHQNMSQLKRSDGSDLRETILANTAIKRYHAVRDPESQKLVAAASGRALYYDMSWDQLKRRAVGQGEIDRTYACTGADSVMRVGITQRVGDRLEAEDLARMNRRIDQSVLLVERGEGLTQLAGGVVLNSDWPLDKETYDRRAQQPWPEATPGTLSAGAPAPEGPESGSSPSALDEVERRLREVSDWRPPADDSEPDDDAPDDESTGENDTET